MCVLVVRLASCTPGRTTRHVGVDVNELEWWRGPRKSTGAGNVSGRWLRVGRAVMCKCWALDQDMWYLVKNHEVGVEGVPRRPRSLMSAGETPAGWDKCPHKWELGSPGVQVGQVA